MEHNSDYEKGRCCKMGTTAILLCQYRHPTINIDFPVECTWAYHAIFLFCPKGLMFLLPLLNKPKQNGQTGIDNNGLTWMCPEAYKKTLPKAQRI